MSQQQSFGLPLSLRYNVASSNSIMAECEMRNYASNNGSVFSDTITECRIPVSSDSSFLDVKRSYLYYEIENCSDAANGNDFALDADMFGMIDQLRIESPSGVVLERIDNFGTWSAFYQRQTQGLDGVNARNIKQGGPGFGGGAPTNTGATVVKGTKASFCGKIPCAWFNPDHGKALPSSTAFTIIIRFHSNVGAAVVQAAGVPEWKIHNPRWYCPAMTLQNAAVQSDYNAIISQRGISWSATTAKTYRNSIPAVEKMNVLQLNDRSVSLKGFATLLRLSADAYDATKKSNSDTSVSSCRRMTYVIDGQRRPPNGIELQADAAPYNLARVYEESLKVLATDSSHTKATVSLGAFRAQEDVGTAKMGSLCLDLKKFSSEPGLKMQGINTASSASPNLVELDMLAAAPTGELDVITYSICGCEFSLLPNGMLSVVV